MTIMLIKNLENNRAKVQNMEAATHYHFRQLAKRIGTPMLRQAAGEPDWIFDPTRVKRAEQLAESFCRPRPAELAGCDQKQEVWVRALLSHYLLLVWARTMKEPLPTSYVSLLFKITNRKLNMLLDWLDGDGEMERIIF